MLGVLGPVAGDHLIISIVSLEREGDLQDMVAWLHDLEKTLNLLALFISTHSGSFPVLDQLFLQDLAGFMVEVLNHVKEQRILCIFNPF